MSDILTLRGIPGLLRRGSPVLATIGDRQDQRGIYIMRDAERATRACVAVEALPGYGEILAWPLVSQCALDLTDATGRAHAQWWLADRLLSEHVQAGRVQTTWLPCDRVPYPAWTLSVTVRRDGSRLDVSRSMAPEDIPALADIYAREPDGCLPDGSRWVDAEALRLVVLHCAGGRAP